MHMGEERDSSTQRVLQLQLLLLPYAREKESVKEREKESKMRLICSSNTNLEKT